MLPQMLVRMRRRILSAVIELRGASVRVLPYPGSGASTVMGSKFRLSPPAPPSVADLIKVLHALSFAAVRVANFAESQFHATHIAAEDSASRVMHLSFVKSPESEHGLRTLDRYVTDTTSGRWCLQEAGRRNDRVTRAGMAGGAAAPAAGAVAEVQVCGRVCFHTPPSRPATCRLVVNRCSC